MYKATKNKKVAGNDTFTATKNRSYDTAMVYEWEKANKESIEILNTITTKTNNNEYVSAEELESYRKALDSYIETSNNLRGISKAFGGTVDDDETWESNITSMRSNFDATQKYYSRFKTEDAYKEALAGQKEYEGYFSYDTKAGQAEIDRLQEIVDEYAKIPTPSYSNTDRGGSAQAKADAYNSAVAEVAKKYGISYADAKKQLSEKSAYHTLAVRAQKAVEFASVADTESENYDKDFEKYATQGKSMDDGNTPWELGGKTVADNPIEAWRRFYADSPNVEEDYGAGKIGKAASFALAMTEDEVDLHNYYLAKDKENGTHYADEYLNLIAEDVNGRVASGYFSQVEDKPLLEVAFEAYAGIEDFISGAKGIFSDEYTPVSAMQYAADMVRDDLYDVGPKLPEWLGGASLGQVAADFARTGANMLPSILASAVAEAALPTVGEGALVFSATTAKNIGKGVGAAVLGASAGGNGKAEMLRLGYSLEQANSYGAMVAIAEGGLEYLLGSIPGISKGDGIFSTLSGKVATKVDNAISKVAIKLGNKGTSILRAAANGGLKMIGGSLDEAFEEGLQAVIEPWMKEAATNVDWDNPSVDEILYSSLLGAITSFALGGGTDIASEVSTYKKGRAMQKVDGGVERLKSAGSLFSADTVAYKIADKVNENTDAYTIGKLFYEVGATLSEQNISDIENGLLELGMSADHAKKIARDYAKYLDTWTNLTDEGKAIFSSLDPLAKVLRNKIIGKNTNIYQRTAEYKDLMALADEVGNPKKAKSERTPEESAEPAMNVFDQQALMGEVQKVASDISRDANRPLRSAMENKMAETENVALQNVKNTLGVKGVYTSDDTGATRLKNNKQRVNIVGVESVGKNGMMLKLSDGSVVDAKEINFSTSDEALVYEAVANMGMSANTAWEIIKGFDSKGNQKGAIYAMGALEAYTYGHNGVKVEGMSKNGFSSLLSATQKNTANKYGDIDARAKVDAKQSKIDAEYNKARNEAKSKGKAIPKRKGQIVFDGDRSKLTDLQEKQFGVLENVAKGLGVSFHVFKSEVDANGKRYYKMSDGTYTSANGWYDPKTGEIWIDLYAGNDGQGTMIFTAAHELTHFIAQWSPAKFKVFADFLMEQYGKKGQNVNQLIRAQIAKAKANGRTISWDEAYEEVVADSAETFLRDSKAAEKIAALHERDAGLANKIKSFIGQMLAKMRKVMEDLGLAPETPEGKMVAEMTDSLQKLYDLWTDALADAGKKYSTLAEIDFDTESVAPMLSERTWTASEYVTEREETAKKIAKALGVDIKTAYKYIDDINGMARLIADDRARLDYEPNLDDKATVLKPNSEYKYSVDMSTLCAKRLLFTGTFDAIQRALPNTVFDSEDIVSLREMMQKRGYEVACGICYVESTRREIGRITQDFINSYKESQKTGKPITRINSEGKAVDLKKTTEQKKTTADKSTDKFFAEKDYTPTLADLNTTDIDIVKRDHPLVYEAYLNFMNARGQAKPKLLETRAEYKGEILKHFKAKAAVTARNNSGGLRLQSFSDFEVPHLIDMMQIVMDMSRVGLKSQAYTKVPAFAEVFGDSGVKINLSLIAKGDGLDSKGNLIFDDVEGINHEEAFKLRDKYSKNVGTILVGKTDAHIIAAMADPRIDYIIPFHKSSWKESLYDALGLTGYADYTDFQNEKPIDKDRKIKNFDPSEYWDFSKTGDENAQTYLKKCREDGRIPKFPQFQGYPGYWKLLIDFKMYDNDGVGSPQEVVRPVFNTEASEKILAEYKGGHKSFPVAKDVVEDFVKEHKDKVKHSDREFSEDYTTNTLNSFGIKKLDDSVHIQRQVLATLLNEGFFADSKTRSRTDINEESGLVIETNKSGIDETFSFNNFIKLGKFKKIAKLATIRELPNAIKYGHIVADGVANKYDSADKNKKFAYIEYATEIDGQDIVVKLAIKKSPQKNKFWVHSIYTIENVSDSPASTKDGTEAGHITADSKGIIPQDSVSVKRKLSDRASYAPTFYSYMGKVIDGIKLDKMGAGGVVSYLKGKGVKNEEIKWSGIEAFLEGKKSVTKAELQEFIAGSQLTIEEEMSGEDIDLRYDGSKRAYNLLDEDGKVIDTFTYNEFLDGYIAESDEAIYLNEYDLIAALRDEYGKASAPRWTDYRLDGGTNYRELVFKMPNSSYSNNAMRGHWGQEVEGVIAHARIQDMTTSDGKKMLFIEEIQSDWHNEGREKGYTTKEYEDAVAVYDRLEEDYLNKKRAFHKYVRSSEFHSDPDEVSKKKFDWLRSKMDTAEKRMQDAERDVNALKEKGMGDVPDAPFRTNYHEYVLKRLLRMAAEEGYDSIGWTTADIQSMRWSEDYAEGYRIEYDQDIPKFLKKYGKKWGATVGKAEVGVAEHTVNGEHYDAENIEVWSMDIPDSMTESVLYEGQVMYSDRVTDKKTLDFLENQEHITTYKSFVEIDGKLYSPMATKVKGDDGKYRLTNPSELGVWQQAEEKPNSIPKFHKSGYGYYVLKKDDGGTVTAAYNPYEHSSNLVLNDQFESAYQRPNLVTVECIIPKSEMTSGYKAQYAKDSTGYLDWKSGTVAGKLKDNKRKVYLSRWLKPVRILSDAEVASMYKDILGTNISVPFNVVTPQLLTELDKVGVKIDYEGSPGYQYRQSKKASDADIKLSDRSSDSVSNRTLLANALEGVAQNDIERKKLTQYKEKISLIETEQAKLDEIRAKIKKLYSAEGKRDTKAINDLRFEENQTANRINTYDRQLLTLESTTALKGVLEREKQMAYQKAKQEGKDALARQRARSAKTTRELLNRHKEQVKAQRERATERKDKTTLRRKIRKVVKELNSLLKNGTKKRNIKEEMKDTVATSLALAEVLFNDDIKNEDIVRLGVESVTVQESEYLNKYRDLLDERDSLRAKIESIYASGIVREKMLAEVGEVEAEIKKLDGRIAYLNNKLSDVFERERARLNRSTIDSIINELATEYAKLKTSENDYIKNAYNEAMQARIESLAEALKGTVVKDMDVNQLSELYDMFKAIEHMIRHSNSLFREGRTEDLMTYVSNVQGELYEASIEQKDRRLAVEKVASFIREFSWNNLRPVDAVERLGSETFEKLFWDFVHAMGVAATDITEAGEVIASAREKFGYSKWNMKLADTAIATRDGMTFKPSLADKLSIYAYSKREQAETHMVEGGFTYDTGNTYKETEKGKTYVRRKLSNTYRLSKENIQAIIDSLTAEQKGYVDAILPYLTDMGKKGNEVSMTLYGIELFGEKVYFPLQSSRDYLSSTTQTLGATPTMASLANSGFTKQTKPHASNPIVLRGFDDVVLEHIEKMSNYHALVIPIENLRRVFDNVGRETEGMPISTKALIGSRFGVEAQKYFEQWLTDINGGVMPSGVKSPFMKLFARAKGMSVAANLSVVAQQYFSIVRAMEVVDSKYFIPFLNGEAKKTDTKQYEELLKYAPIAIIKEMGGFDVGSNGRAKDYIGYEGARKDAKYINKKIDDLSMWGAGAMDKLGWVTIWKAVKAEVASEHNLTPGTDKFYEACRIRFTEVVTKTQVFDSVASRSGYMRSQHDAVKYATSFMGEPTAIMGRYFVAGVNLVRAIKSGNKARIKSAWGRCGRTAAVIAVSGVLGNIAKSLVYAGRDDEEDEALLEKWMRNFAEALRDDLNILNSLPFGRDLVSVIEGWDVERPDMTLIADMVTSTKKMLDGDITFDDSLNLVGSVGNFFGKPLKNVIREIESAINVFGDIFDDVRPTDMGGAFVEGITGDERTKMETLYDAIVRGDKSKVEAIKATYKDESAYTTAVRTALRENDSRVTEAAMAFFEQDHKKRQSLTLEIEKEGNFTPAIVRGAINNEIEYIRGKIKDANAAKKRGDDEEYKKIVKKLREKYPKDFVEKVLG